MHNIVFTKEFKEGYENIPSNLYPKVEEFLKQLRDNPVIKNNNITALKNQSHGFRRRFGDYRLIYRVLFDKVLLLKIGLRKEIYINSNKSFKIYDGSIDELIAVTCNNQVIIEQVDSEEKDNINELQAEEFLIDSDELNLIDIPTGYHEQILKTNTLVELEKSAIPKGIITRILDYITNPNQSHIGKLYTLSEEDDFIAVAQRPLRDFMLSLDAEQKAVISKLDKGPLLVRGGPGTGKTLVGLYWLKEIIENQTASVFNSEQPSFMFISYVNSLVNTSKEVFNSITRVNDINISFLTLDKFIASELSSYKLGGIVKEDDLKFRLKKMTIDKMKVTGDSIKINAIQRVENIGIEFLMEEIEKIIEANDIKTLDNYINFERKGRGKALQKPDREAIWIVYDFFRNLCKSTNRYTWSGKRQFYLHLIESGQLMPKMVDYLVLDESQDMSLVSLRIITYMVKDPQFLLLLADSGQSIYNKSFTWRGVSPVLKFHKGNSFNLLKSYRMTKQNSKALKPLRIDADTDAVGITTGVFEGEKPFWWDIPLEEQDEAVVDIVRELVEEKGINAGQIGIILRMTERPCRFASALRNNGFEVDVLDEKHQIDIYGNAIHIITAHSSKGLEFPFVIVPNISDNIYPCKNSKPDNELLEDEWVSMEQRILYVALSRAQHRLWMLSDNTNPSRFLSKLDMKDWIRDKK